jgi:hypothetical protein
MTECVWIILLDGMMQAEPLLEGETRP